MRVSPRRALAVLTVATLVAGLCAGAATARPRASVTLTALVATAQQPTWGILIANFERVYPDIHVEANFLTSAAITQLIPTQMQAGNAPDVFHMQAGRGGTAAVLPLAEAGRLLDLSKEVWVKRLAPYMKPAVTYQGKLFAYPYSLFLNDVVYNTDQFKQYGLSVPTTMSAVLALCRKITAAGKVPFAQPFGEISSGALLGQQRAVQYVYTKYPNWNTLRAQGKMTFQSTPEWRRAFQSIVEMKDAGCFQPGAQGSAAAATFGMVARGDAVQSLMASTQSGNIPTLNPATKTKFYNLPGDTAAQQAIIMNGNMIGVNAASKHPKEAKLFIQFLSRPKQAALFAKSSGGNSYYDVLKGILPDSMVNLRPLVKAGKVVWAPQISWPNPALATYIYGSLMQGIFTGQRTVDDLLKAADYMWDHPDATSAPL